MGHELSHDVARASKLGRDLRESQHRMDLAARAGALGFWTWDIARDDIWASDTARELFEIAPTERISIGRFLETLHPEDIDGVKNAIEVTLGEAWSMTWYTASSCAGEAFAGSRHAGDWNWMAGGNRC